MADGGFTLAWMAVPTVGKRVFLRVVSAIPTVMRGMTSEDTKEQKAAVGGKKSPARAGTKEIVNRIAVSSGNSEPKVTGAALCGAER